MLDKDENYRVTLRSYHKYLISTVQIECEDYEIFKEIVDVVKPILEEEERVGNEIEEK